MQMRYGIFIHRFSSQNIKNPRMSDRGDLGVDEEAGISLIMNAEFGIKG